MKDDDRRRGAMLRTYLSLWMGELAAAAVFVTVAVVAIEPRATSSEGRLALWSALIPLLTILVQAGAYWILARTWVGRSDMPLALARAYRTLGLVDGTLLLAGLVAVLIWLPEDPSFILLVVAIWLFGVIEYVNYFVVRLAYPITQWPRAVAEWRTPRLVQDIRGAQRTPGHCSHD